MQRMPRRQRLQLNAVTACHLSGIAIVLVVKPRLVGLVDAGIDGLQ